jgi:integrase
MGKKDRPAVDPFSIQDAEVLIAAIHRDWGEVQGNYDEFRFFTGLRLSEQLALVVSDFEPVHGTLSVTKARVAGIDRDRTKTGEDRRIHLCARARAVLERQLRLRQQLKRLGRINHDHLLQRGWHADPSLARAVRTLAPDAAEPFDSLSQALRRATFIRELEPHDGAQSALGGQAARAQRPHHAHDVRGVD